MAVHQTLRSFNISFEKLVGFGADGCSTMLGKDNGVAVKLRMSSPSLVSFHCPAHRLQLAIVDITAKVTSSTVSTYLRMSLLIKKLRVSCDNSTHSTRHLRSASLVL